MTDGTIGGPWGSKPKGELVFLAVLIVCSSIPIALGGGFTSYDVVIPGLFALTLVDVATRAKTLDYFLPRRGNLQAVFVTLFFFTILISYARKPLLPAGLLGTESDITGIKLYWRYISCLLAYLTAIYWINRNRVPPAQIFGIMFYLALAMTILGFFVFVTQVKIPGLRGHVWELSSTSVGAARLPFLGVFSQLGFLIALTEASGSLRRRRLYLALFALGIFLSGGRTVMFSTIAALVVWLALNRKILLTLICAASVILVIVSAKVLQESASSSQVKQFARVGTLSEDSVLRFYLFEQLVEEIKSNPVFGTGFGKSYDTDLIVIRGKFVAPDFVDKQLRSGSHGTHLQLMKNLGIVGYLPFALIWLYPVFSLLPYAYRPSEDVPEELVQAARFTVLITCTLAIRWGFEGNGSRIADYVLAAVICGLVSHGHSFRHRMQKSDSQVSPNINATPTLREVPGATLASRARAARLHAHRRP